MPAPLDPHIRKLPELTVQIALPTPIVPLTQNYGRFFAIWKMMEINRQAPLVAQKRIFIEAPPQIVWNIHTDINDWSRWQPDITASKLENPLAVGSVFRWKSGGLNVTSTIQVIEPSQEIGWTGRSLGAHAKHIWTLTPQNKGTLVTTEESVSFAILRLGVALRPFQLGGFVSTFS